MSYFSYEELDNQSGYKQACNTSMTEKDVVEVTENMTKILRSEFEDKLRVAAAKAVADAKAESQRQVKAHEGTIEHLSADIARTIAKEAVDKHLIDVPYEHYEASDELEGIESDASLIGLAVTRMRAQRNSAIWLDATNASSFVTDKYGDNVELLDWVSSSRRWYPLPGFKGEAKKSAPKVISSISKGPGSRYTSVIWFDSAAKSMTCDEPKNNWPSSVISGGAAKATYFVSFNPTVDSDVTILDHQGMVAILIKDSKIQIKVGALAAPLTDSPDVGLNKWINLCVVINTPDVHVYVNGKLNSRHAMTPSAQGFTKFTLGGPCYINHFSFYPGVVLSDRIIKNYSAWMASS